MPEYIEREALIEDLNYIASEYAQDGSMQCLIAAGTVIHIKDDIVLKAPTADVVEVVRCKDCKKWDTSIRFLNTCACSYWSPSRSSPRLTKPDGFCSYGERKGD